MRMVRMTQTMWVGMSVGILVGAVGVGVSVDGGMKGVMVRMKRVGGTMYPDGGHRPHLRIRRYHGYHIVISVLYVLYVVSIWILLGLYLYSCLDYFYCEHELS